MARIPFPGQWVDGTENAQTEHVLNFQRSKKKSKHLAIFSAQNTQKVQNRWLNPKLIPGSHEDLIPGKETQKRAGRWLNCQTLPGKHQDLNVRKKKQENQIDGSTSLKLFQSEAVGLLQVQGSWKLKNVLVNIAFVPALFWWIYSKCSQFKNLLGDLQPFLGTAPSTPAFWGFGWACRCCYIMP